MGSNINENLRALRRHLTFIQDGNKPSTETLEPWLLLNEKVLESTRGEGVGSIGYQISQQGGANLMLEFLKALRQIGNEVYENNKNLTSTCYSAVRTACWNTSDRSLYFCEECGKCGILSFLVSELNDLKYSFEADYNGLGERVMEGMCILHNCSEFPENVTILQQLDLLPVVNWYRKFTKSLNIESAPDLHFVCTILLSLVVDESQVEILTDVDDIIDQLVQDTSVAMTKSGHQYCGFHAEELIKGLQKLARNHKNGAKIIEEIKDPEFNLFNTFKAQGTSQEKENVLSLLCQLSFVSKKAVSEDQQMIDYLNQVALDNSNLKTQRLAQLVLFVLRDDDATHQNRDLVPTSSKTYPTKLSFDEALLRDALEIECKDVVLICYEGKNKDFVEYVKKDLAKELDCKVWLEGDDENGGFIRKEEITKMQNAKAIIICMSTRCKDSLYCRAVTEYLYRIGANNFIPVLVEENCKLNGWLEYVVSSTEDESYINAQKGYNSRVKSEILQKLKAIDRLASTIGGCTDDLHSVSSESSIEEDIRPLHSSHDDVVRELKLVDLNKTDTEKNKKEGSTTPFNTGPFPQKHLKRGKSKHVMLSYETTYKPLVLQIKNQLQSSGYRTWMDDDDLVSGSLTDELRKAVENSAVFLLCMSSSYEASGNCRDEAEYARKILPRDDIIPIRVEKNYTPRDNWLSFLIGLRYYHNVSEGYTSQLHSKLMKAIGERGKDDTTHKDQ